MECEHADGNLMGVCAICGDMVCDECFENVFNAMICGNHGDLVDETAWELVGFYSTAQLAEERRYDLTEQTLTSMVVETDEDMWELYVPAEEKDDAHAALASASDDTVHCSDCQVFYSKEVGSCPICGTRAIEEES